MLPFQAWILDRANVHGKMEYWTDHWDGMSILNSENGGEFWKIYNVHRTTFSDENNHRGRDIFWPIEVFILTYINPTPLARVQFSNISFFLQWGLFNQSLVNIGLKYEDFYAHFE